MKKIRMVALIACLSLMVPSVYAAEGGEADAPSPAVSNQAKATVTDPAEIKDLRSQLETLQRKNEEASKTSQQRIEELNKKLSSLNDKMAARSSERDLIKSLTLMVKQTNEKITTLENSIQESGKAAVDIDKIRYLTGEEIQKVIVHNAATLRVSTMLGAALSEFQRTMNPANDDDFRKELDKLQSKVSKGRGVFLQRLRDAGMFANPILSLAVSTSTFLVESSWGGNYADNIDRYPNLICLNQFASQNFSDVRSIDDQIKSLDARVGEFERVNKERFRIYASVVGFTGGYDEVRASINATSIDPLKKQANDFFASNIKPRKSQSEPLSENYISVRFQIEKVKEYIAEYESLLKEIDTFFASFEQVVKKNSIPMDECKSKPSISRISQKLEKLASSVADTKKQFESAYFNSISADSRRILYSGQ